MPYLHQGKRPTTYAEGKQKTPERQGIERKIRYESAIA